MGQSSGAVRAGRNATCTRCAKRRVPVVSYIDYRLTSSSSDPLHTRVEAPGASRGWALSGVSGLRQPVCHPAAQLGHCCDASSHSSICNLAPKLTDVPCLLFSSPTFFVLVTVLLFYFAYSFPFILVDFGRVWKPAHVFNLPCFINRIAFFRQRMCGSLKSTCASQIRPLGRRTPHGQGITILGTSERQDNLGHFAWKEEAEEQINGREETI